LEVRGGGASSTGSCTLHVVCEGNQTTKKRRRSTRKTRTTMILPSDTIAQQCTASQRTKNREAASSDPSGRFPSQDTRRVMATYRAPSCCEWLQRYSCAVQAAVHVGARRGRWGARCTGEQRGEWRSDEPPTRVRVRPSLVCARQTPIPPNSSGGASGAVASPCVVWDVACQLL